MTTTPTPTPTPTPAPALQLEQQAVKRTWKPTTAGILTLIAGILNVIAGIVVAAVGSFIGPMVGWMGFGAIGAPLIIIGIISIVGGVFAIQRRTWGMALAGAICALFPPPIIILGILAIIFLALSRKEFA